MNASGGGADSVRVSPVPGSNNTAPFSATTMSKMAMKDPIASKSERRRPVTSSVRTFADRSRTKASWVGSSTTASVAMVPSKSVAKARHFIGEESVPRRNSRVVQSRERKSKSAFEIRQNVRHLATESSNSLVLPIPDTDGLNVPNLISRGVPMRLVQSESLKNFGTGKKTSTRQAIATRITP